MEKTICPLCVIEKTREGRAFGDEPRDFVENGAELETCGKNSYHYLATIEQFKMAETILRHKFIIENGGYK